MQKMRDLKYKSKIFTVLDDDIIISKNYFYEGMNILNKTKSDLIF